MFHGTSVLRMGHPPESFSESFHPLNFIQQIEITGEGVTDHFLAHALLKHEVSQLKPATQHQHAAEFQRSG